MEYKPLSVFPAFCGFLNCGSWLRDRKRRGGGGIDRNGAKRSEDYGARGGRVKKGLG